MIIGFDGSRAFKNQKTGTENYSFYLLKALSKIDKNNTYYIYTYSDISINPSDWPTNFIFKPINYPKLWTQVGLSLQTFKDKLDVLFIPSHTLPLIRNHKLKTVLTVHDLGAQFLPKTHQLKQRLYLKYMTDHQLQTASHLIAVSKATKDDLVKKVGILEEKISVIYEGYDENNFKVLSQKEIDQIISKYQLEYQKYFLFVGSIQPRKNLVRLIKAYSEFIKQFPSLRAQRSNLKNGITTSHTASHNDKDFVPKLILAGGKGWLSDEIYNLPQKLGVGMYINFLGFVPNKDLAGLYNGSLGLLFPSLFEGFGLPILEAWACNCSVLTSNTSSLPEVAGDAAILVDPYNEEAITKGMINIYHNPKLRDQLIKKGNLQLKKFSWEKCAKETLEILKQYSKP